MSATPTASASDDKKMEQKDRFTRQIETAFEEAAKLAGSNLAPTEFYTQFLNKTLSAIDAPAGAVWLRTPQGFLQVACQVNLEKVGLESKRGGRQCHNEVLRQVFQANPPRPVLLEPNARMAAGPGEPGPVPPANLTDHFALFAPIIASDKQPLGVLEVFQDPSHDPRLYPPFLNYLFQMAGYASQYNQFITARAGSSSERTFTAIESFARHIHGTLNPTEVAYHVANEGRKLIECDRLCVGIRYARRKVTVEAVSGADVVEKASTHVRRLRWLMEAVLAWGEPLIFKGTKDSGLPPDVASCLDDYLNESHPKLLIVQPIRDEREKDNAKPARSVLVLESFNPPDQSEGMVQRLEVIAKHAAPALYNAAELKRVPLKFLWWPLAKLQEGIGGKARFYGIGGALLLFILILVLALVPYQLRMEAKGQMLPVEIAQIFPPREGIVRDIRVKPGDQIDPRFPVVTLFSQELQKEYRQVLDKYDEANSNISGLEGAIKDLGPDPNTRDTKLKFSTDLVSARQRRESALAEMAALDAQYNSQSFPAGVVGLFRAVTPNFDPKLARPRGSSKWTVLNDDRRENLLGRTMKPHEELLRVGNLAGYWQVEMKIPQRNIGQVMKAFADPSLHLVDVDGKPYLEVDVLLSSKSETSYRGRLYRADIAAQAVPNKNEHDENEPVVTSYVKLNLSDFKPEDMIPTEQFVTGLEVRARVRCGKHALGYSLFHGVWEWFYEKVVFFF